MVQQKVPIGEDISQQRVECGEARGLGHHQEQKTVVPPSSTVRELLDPLGAASPCRLVRRVGSTALTWI